MCIPLANLKDMQEFKVLTFSSFRALKYKRKYVYYEYIWKILRLCVYAHKYYKPIER